jgi:hypothetical protein
MQGQARMPAPQEGYLIDAGNKIQVPSLSKTTAPDITSLNKILIQ